jgi:hypothetical protein
MDVLRTTARRETELACRSNPLSAVYGRQWNGTAEFRFELAEPFGWTKATMAAVENDSRWRILYVR